MSSAVRQGMEVIADVIGVVAASFVEMFAGSFVGFGRASRALVRRTRFPVLVFLSALSVTAAIPVPELALQIDGTIDSSWAQKRSGDPASAEGFAFSLSRDSETRVFALTGRIQEDSMDELKLSPNEEQEVAGLGREIERRRIAFSEVTAIELRIEGVDRRLIVRLFQWENRRCCVIAVSAARSDDGLVIWPDEDAYLSPLFGRVRCLSRPRRASEPSPASLRAVEAHAVPDSERGSLRNVNREG